MAFQGTSRGLPLLLGLSLSFFGCESEAPPDGCLSNLECPGGRCIAGACEFPQDDAGIADDADDQDAGPMGCDEAHLGATCAPLAGAEAIACEDSACLYTCLEGFTDLDGDLDSLTGNGCESACIDEESVCDGLDEDCDGEIDEGCDDDSDGFCDASVPLVGSPEVCPLGGEDCDDENPDIHPAQAESCDDIDNNCDLNVDEGCDDDADGFCDADLLIAEGATPLVCPSGGGDCDDEVETTNPDAQELCDGIDNNCDEAVDADDPSYSERCADQLGVCAGALARCEGGTPVDCVATDYAAAAQDRGARFEDPNLNGEVSCDGEDNDCDGQIDEVCDPEACEDLILDNGDEARFDTAHPAVAHGPRDSTRVAIAWVERTGPAVGALHAGVYDTRTGAFVAPMAFIDGSDDGQQGDGVGWPAIAWSDALGAFVVAYQQRSGSRVFTLSPEGEHSAPVDALNNPSESVLHGPPALALEAARMVISQLPYNVAIPSVISDLCRADTIEDWSCAQLDVPGTDTLTTFSSGEGRFGIALHDRGVAIVTQEASDFLLTLALVDDDNLVQARHDVPTHIGAFGFQPSWPLLRRATSDLDAPIDLFYFGDQTGTVFAHSRWDVGQDLLSEARTAAVPDFAGSLQVLSDEGSDAWIAFFVGRDKVYRVKGDADQNDAPTVVIEEISGADDGAIGAPRRLRDLNPLLIGRGPFDTPGVGLRFVNLDGAFICPEFQ